MPVTNLWSVVTLALGALGFLALLRPVFWIVPLMAIVIGLVSLRSLATHPEQIGRRAVLVGLAVAVFFGAWASTRYFSRSAVADVAKLANVPTFGWN